METDLKHGDCIVGKFKALGHPSEHWAIWDGRAKQVIELSGTRRDSSVVAPQKKGGTAFLFGSGYFATVQTTTPAVFFDDWDPSGGVFRVQWASSYMPQRAANAVINARKQVGEHPSYKLLPVIGDQGSLNCESFVRKCHTGIARAAQTAKVEETWLVRRLQRWEAQPEEDRERPAERPDSPLEDQTPDWTTATYG
jgi:hypothetical protein